MHLNNVVSGRKCQCVLHLCCILGFCFLLYLYFTQGPGGQEYRLKSKVFPLYPHQGICDSSHELSISGQVTLYELVLKDCKFRANLQTQPRASLPMCIYDPTSDLEISAKINKTGEWDPPNLQTIKTIFQHGIRFNGIVSYELTEKRSHDPVGVTSVANEGHADYKFKEEDLSLVDLGCNIGAFTLTIASMGYQVLAVDAMEESLQLLATSLRMNNLTSLVTLVNNAVSNWRGPVHVHVNAKNRGASFITENETDSNANTLNQSRKPVSAVCLDDLVPHVRTGRVFLKMDIEGYESKALLCARKFFNAVDVPYVFMEWVFHRHNPNGASIIDFMTRRNFIPIQHPQSAKTLEPGSYASWPENVLWIKRK